MVRRLLFLLIIFIISTIEFSAVAAEVPVLVAPPTSLGSPGLLPVIAPTGDGYGIAWLDFRQTPGQPDGGFRFSRFDLSGNRVGQETLLDIAGWQDPYNGGHLGALKGGFLLFARSDLTSLHTLRLDPSGRPLGPSNVLVSTVELHRPSVASTRSGFLVTYPEWFGTWFDWSQPVDEFGLADGSRYRISVDISGGENPIYDSPIAPSPSGFFTAWIQGSAGIRLRELANNGRPQGDVVPVTGGGECEADISTAFAGKREVIVFAAGCQQKDVTLVTRGPHAELSTPVLLTSQPYDEGLDRCGFQRGLHVAGAGDRIGVLYRAYPPGRESCLYSSSAWFFAEYDLSGRRIGPARDLLLEFGLDSDDDVTLARDDDNNRYLLSWAGGGPQGAGTYYVPLEPAH